MYRSYSGHTAVIVIATAVIHFRCQGGEIHRSAGGGAVAMLPDKERMDVLALDSAAPNLEPRGIRASVRQETRFQVGFVGWSAHRPEPVMALEEAIDRRYRRCQWAPLVDKVIPITACMRHSALFGASVACLRHLLPLPSGIPQFLSLSTHWAHSRSSTTSAQTQSPRPSSPWSRRQCYPTNLPELACKGMYMHTHSNTVSAR